VGGCAPRAPEDSLRPRRLSGVCGRPLNFTVRVRNKIRLCSEVDESEEPRPRRFVWDGGEARTARTLVGAHGIHRLRLRLSPLWLCSMSGRAPRPCSLRQLVVSALAQETECLRWSPWARLPFAAVGFGLRRRSRARTVGWFRASSNQAPERTRGVRPGESTENVDVLDKVPSFDAEKTARRSPRPLEPHAWE
jgi:hypothetical protein